MLSFEHIKFHYKNRPPVLEDVSFSLEKGDCVCLLGPNGTGKTTLLKCLIGSCKPQNGRITLDGKDLLSMGSRQRALHLAYVSQFSALAFPYTVEEVVQMGRVCHLRLGSSLSGKDKKIAADAMEHLGISHMAGRNFQTLSGGEKQMVLIARALAQQADYLILDEPTAALDYSNQVRILELIKRLSKEGYGILMTSHFPDHAFLCCSKAVLMREGHVMAFGSPQECVTSENLTRLYHVPVEVTEAVLENKYAAGVQKVCIPLLQTIYKGEE